jgi:hypothetical protein
MIDSQRIKITDAKAREIKVPKVVASCIPGSDKRGKFRGGSRLVTS